MGSDVSMRRVRQMDIARATGYKQPAISRWLSGRVMPRAEVVEELASHIGVSAEELIVYIYRRNAEHRKENISA